MEKQTQIKINRSIVTEWYRISVILFDIYGFSMNSRAAATLKHAPRKVQHLCNEQYPTIRLIYSVLTCRLCWRSGRQQFLVLRQGFVTLSQCTVIGRHLTCYQRVALIIYVSHDTSFGSLWSPSMALSLDMIWPKALQDTWCSDLMRNSIFGLTEDKGGLIYS